MDKKDLMIFDPFPEFKSSSYSDEREFQRRAVQLAIAGNDVKEIEGIDTIRDQISPFQVQFNNRYIPLASYLVLCGGQVGPESIISIFSNWVVPELKTKLAKMTYHIEEMGEMSLQD
jgi:hypothetical protein